MPLSDSSGLKRQWGQIGSTILAHLSKKAQVQTEFLVFAGLEEVQMLIQDEQKTLIGVSRLKKRPSAQ